ncbi:MAG TPA: hypothetical protein VLW85_10075, partial [Myxococcales bacterium]|nr:hypothetical protein [Myxococcales bacterium]
SLLHDDATLSMPPYRLWLRGPETIRAWLYGPGCGCEGSRLIPVAACGSPAFGQFRPHQDGGFRPWALIVDRRAAAAALAGRRRSRPPP